MEYRPVRGNLPFGNVVRLSFVTTGGSEPRLDDFLVVVERNEELNSV